MPEYSARRHATSVLLQVPANLLLAGALGPYSHKACVLLACTDHLTMLTPGMITVANPGAAKLVASAGRPAASMRIGVMICVSMLASASEDPAAFSRDVEEVFTSTFSLFAPAQRSVKLLDMAERLLQAT